MHVILSGAASDLAALYGKRDSKEFIIHRGMALAGVSKALVNRGAGRKLLDENLVAAVALFAGNAAS